MSKTEGLSCPERASFGVNAAAAAARLSNSSAAAAAVWLRRGMAVAVSLLGWLPQMRVLWPQSLAPALPGSQTMVVAVPVSCNAGAVNGQYEFVDDWKSDEWVIGWRGRKIGAAKDA
jgi:hypothetical protein